MDLISIFIIAAGLSADSFAVSVANGFGNHKLKFKHNIFIALSFAVFQAVMPLLGMFFGSGFSKYAANADHWIAFILLSGIGIKMIYENFNKENENKSNKPGLNFITVISQSLATSIDAFIIGISFAFLKINIFLSIAVIGAVTFIFSLAGFCAGKKTGKKFSGYAGLIGGIILILLGIKILIEHIYFS